jgi:Superinfection immunity protein
VWCPRVGPPPELEIALQASDNPPVTLADAGVGFLLLLVALYFLPTIIAWARGVSSIGPIIAINVFLGWTFIGWVVALAMAVRSVPQSTPAPAATAPASTRECPYCKEAMRRDASVCPHCHRESPAWTLREGHWWSNVDGVWYRLDEASNSWVRSEVDSTEAKPTAG